VSATSASVAIVSAVPDGLVIARDDVFGMVSPSAVTIGTTTIVVRLPGTPPIECLSTMGAARDHRLGEGDQLRAVELPQRAGEHEHRELGLRVAACAHVAQHRIEVGARKPRAAELAAHALDALGCGRKCRTHERTLRLPEVAESDLGESDLVAP
jgi:hypothetical protein